MFGYPITPGQESFLHQQNEEEATQTYAFPYMLVNVYFTDCSYVYIFYPLNVQNLINL